MIGGSKVRTCLWFEQSGKQAAEYYVSLVPGSFIESAEGSSVDDTSGERADEPLVVAFTLGGAPFMIVNGGPHYRLSPAASISVTTANQEETDHLWTALLAGGGTESQCGWLTDRYGLSWQIVPETLLRLQAASDKEAATRVREALMSMVKIDIARLEAAYRGE